MRTPLQLVVVVALTACMPKPPGGTQIGALRDELPPNLPADFLELDLMAATEEALTIGGISTLAGAWRGHAGSFDHAVFDCPHLRLGAPPEDLVDLNLNNDDLGEGMSWIDDCSTPDAATFDGFTYWDTEITQGGALATRSLIADTHIEAADGSVLFDFDGEAEDSLEGGAYTSSIVARGLRGSLVGLGGGLRGEVEASWSDTGDVSLFGAVTMLDGFGPPDGRTLDPEETPELSNVPSWEPGMPRFTSVRFDLTWDESCDEEPLGYIGIRGNEGFWFDVYFLPIYDLEEDSAEANAFPFGEVSNTTCDGIGTVFVRNIAPNSQAAEGKNFTAEIQPDFAAVLDGLPRPALEDFVLTLHQIPQEESTP